MITEEHLRKAKLLAQALTDVDDNEVKKVYSFLCRNRQMSVLHQLVGALPASPFKDRSRRTQRYYERLKDVIPRHLPADMDVNDAVQIFGYACRLLKYEAGRREQQRRESDGRRQTGPRPPRRGQRGGRRR